MSGPEHYRIYGFNSGCLTSRGYWPSDVELAEREKYARQLELAEREKLELAKENVVKEEKKERENVEV